MALGEEEAAAAARCEPPARRRGLLAAGVARVWARGGGGGGGLVFLPPQPWPDRSTGAGAAAVAVRGPLAKAVMLLGVLLVLCQRVQAEQGTEQQQINVAPSSESFTNWRAILSPTWPSRELESSSVADVSVKQALENANLRQIIRSTLAGARSRTMDQTRVLPSLYQGSGNSASQEPPEVAAESSMRSQDADEMTIVSGLPQISVFSTLSSSPSVTRPTNAVSSQIMPYAPSSISNEIFPGSGILPTSSSSSLLPLVKKSPHVITVSNLIVQPTKVPSFTNAEFSLSLNSVNSHFLKGSGSTPNTVSARNPGKKIDAVSRKGGKEFSVSPSFSNNFGLIDGNSTVPVGGHTVSRNRKLHVVPSNQTSLVLAAQSMSFNSRKNRSFTRLFHQASFAAMRMSQPPEAVRFYKESKIYEAASPSLHQNKIANPGVSAPAPHTSSTPSALLKMINYLDSVPVSSSTKEIPLTTASENPRLFRLVTNVASHTVSTPVISEAMSTRNAIAEAPAPEHIPLSYSTNEFISAILGANQTFNTAAHVTVSIPKGKATLKIHLMNPHITRRAIAKDTSGISYGVISPRENDPTWWPPNYFFEKSVLHPSLSKGTAAPVFTEADVQSVFPFQPPWTHVTNLGAEGQHISHQTPWKAVLEKMWSQERTRSGASLQPLPTSFRGLLKTHSIVTFISSPNRSENIQLKETDEQSPTHSLMEEKKGAADKSTSAVSYMEHLSYPPLNKPDAEMHESLHMTEASYRPTSLPSDIYVLASFTPVVKYLKSPVSASLDISSAASEGISGVLKTEGTGKTTTLISQLDGGDWPTSAGGMGTYRKRMTPRSKVSKHNASPTPLRIMYTEVPELQQQTNYLNKNPFTSTSSDEIAMPNVQSNSESTVTRIKPESLTEMNPYSFAIDSSFDQYLPVLENFSQSTEMPPLQSKKDTYSPGNILEYFTAGNINFTSSFEKKSSSVPKDFTAANRRPSTKVDAFPPTLSYSHFWPFLSYAKAQTVLKPQMTDSESPGTSTNAFYATSPPLSLASQFIAKLTVPGNSSKKATASPTPVYDSSNSTATLHIIEEYMTSRKTTLFTNNLGSETNNYLSAQPKTLSAVGWHAKGAHSEPNTVKVLNETTEITSLQTHTPNTAIITPVHASRKQLTSLLPTTNFTHSVITVLPSVSPGVTPSVATSEATPITGKSAPTSPMLTSSLFSLSTENLPSVMALSTLISTLAKSSTAAKMALTLSPIVTHATFPVVSRDESATPMHTTSSLSHSKSSTESSPTTHTPRQTETTVLNPRKPTIPDITKTSTAYPLTITAALTSITASAKTTRLLPTPAENTSAAAAAAAITTPPVSTAAFANVTTIPPLECQLSRNLLIKTVLFLDAKRLLPNDSFKQNVTKGLTQALQRAFNQNVNAQIEILEQSNNVTVGYYVTQERLVFIPAVVVEMLIAYGVSNATSDIKQHVPNLHSVAVLALPWNPLPAYHFQLKTELQFVSQSDNIHSCRFVQTMEQRLQKAFEDAEKKVLNTTSKLTVQILNTSNISQSVSLFYVVRNESTVLNGTVSSHLLNHLSAELVGFYLTYPPLTIAEALEYPNLDISEATRDYWVITVIQGVDITLLGANNQSFARLMEQRLAPLFLMSHQQGRRFKRATTVGSYTVQIVKMQRIPGPKEPAELTYYTLYNGNPLLGTTAAKILSTVDSQRMALTLGYVVQVQADPVVKNPPNNLWIIAAVLAPIAVVTIIIIIITAVLCRKNKNDFKGDTMMNLPQRTKPVQGFDYAKQHLGQQGAEDEVLPVTQETVVLPLPVRDASASQERDIIQDGSMAKTAKSNDTRKRSPSENGSVISNESGKPNSGRSSPQKVMAQQKVTKEEGRKRNVAISDEEEGGILFDNVAKSAIDPFDTSSGSVQLIAIKPVPLPSAHPTSDRNQESAILNGEINKALKQKSDIEHYRNKLRLKAKRKGYYDFPPVDNNKGLADRKKIYEKAQNEIDHILDPDTDGSSPFIEPPNRQQMKNSVYRSRQSLNSPSPGETEMDLLVTRERQRRGIRNSGYDTEPEMIEETNIDRVNEPRNYTRSHQAKGHSETSTLSSQPSIDEVRQQMHMLLEEAFNLASAGHGGQSRQQDTYSSTQQLPYSEVVTSAPGTMSRPRGGIQWVPAYRPEVYQYSLPRPAYRFSPLPEMVTGSPPPPVPPRTGPVAVTSLRRSTSDIGSKTRISESSGTEQIQPHDHAPFVPVSRAPVSVAPLDQSAMNYSGSTVPAVFAIPAANRPGFPGYFIPTSPAAYRNHTWMSYAGENELPGQWADSVPLPGYIEAYSRPCYQHKSPSRLPRQYSQPINMRPSLEHGPLSSSVASQQSLTENDSSDNPLTNLSTAALVKAIREEVAKLAKKQTDMFEFQV
ncbi:hypothetical protein JRQ81_000453 [Phrynocephalus forsythii]|uniref:KIAA1549 like n=1 Tax=Phrynocephalus forsythii TaxID=171643 RepID=A0A9Q0Y948_9SAUR|nr:hypothetical protein JRQ81_000453 [Phrynocephalus forsythii]